MFISAYILLFCCLLELNNDYYSKREEGKKYTLISMVAIHFHDLVFTGNGYYSKKCAAAARKNDENATHKSP